MTAKTAKEVLILQHVANEGAGTIRNYLETQKIPFRFIRLYAGELFPKKLETVHSAVIMGGPMNVYQEAEFPFLKEEDTFIRNLIKQEIPCLGVCLGSQLLAKSLGAKVMKAKSPEIGWDEIRFSKEAARDTLFSKLKIPTLRVLQWHEDTSDLPQGAVHLASSQLVPNQAFRYEDRFYGFQFHVEVDRPMLEDWFKKSSDQAKILEEYDQYRTKLSEITEIIYRNFFKLSE
jgi:GMP synthase (glutamine-hydrolysing)